MALSRFDCYLQGGRVGGMQREMRGCRDTSLPAARAVAEIKVNTWFGRGMKSIWGFGGGVVLDHRYDPHACTPVVLHKITLQQFNDVVAQENAQDLPLPGNETISDKQLVAFRRGDASMLQLGNDGYYNVALYLGEVQDVPCITFTCMPEEVKQCIGEPARAAPPAQAYREILSLGLAGHGYDRQTAQDYWGAIIRRQFAPQKQAA